MKMPKLPTRRELQNFIDHETVYLKQQERAYLESGNQGTLRTINGMKRRIKQARSLIVQLSFDDFYQSNGLIE